MLFTHDQLADIRKHTRHTYYITCNYSMETLPLLCISATQMSCKGSGSLARTITILFAYDKITSTATANAGKDSMPVTHYFPFLLFENK